ncbi:MAG: bacteriochlorophyll 4-vinyl reductase [Deinococcus-Thermus bacterium]|nr:bacteriochlorophyll 4-vinyl reductase [Deinococcota bacterium]
MSPQCASAETGARIGPNAIIRTAEALAAQAGLDTCRRVFDRAGLGAYLTTPPAAMVAEDEVVALHRAVRAELAAETADAVMREAGARTARYLLAHRIPQPAQALLRALPPRAASRLLLGLIARHAWTFAGSADLRLSHGRPARVLFAGSPLARVPAADAPVCGFYAGTFETLFRHLVHADAVARETTCAANGDDVCTLELSW